MTENASSLRHDQDGENTGEVESPNLVKLLGILKRLAHQDPRVVLATFVNLDDILKTDEQQQLVKEFRWSLYEKRKAYRQFKEVGFNPEVALGLIEYLQNNVQFCSEVEENAGGVVEKKTSCKHYQYDEDHFTYICRLVSLSDDPIQLVKDISHPLDFDGYYSYPSLFLYHLTEYAEDLSKVVESPNFSEVIALIEKFSDEIDKIDLSNSSSNYDEQSHKHKRELSRSMRVIQDPVVVLSNLGQAELEKLSSEGNIQRAKELWDEISQGHRLRIEHLPELLILANDPQLITGFKEMAAHSEIMTDILGSEPQRLKIAVTRLKELKREVPEIWELLEHGFDVSWIFSYPRFYDSDPLDISWVVQEKYSFREILANQKLMTNATIVARYDDEKLGVRPYGELSDYKRYRYTSDSETLEKSYIVFHSLGTVFMRGKYIDTSRHNLWRNISETGCLENFSVEQVSQLFATIKELVETKDPVFLEALAEMEPRLSDVIGTNPSLIEVRDRFERLLSDEMQAIASDRSFQDFMWEGRIVGATNWDLILTNLDQYHQLLQQKDELKAKLKLLMYPQTQDYVVAVTKDLETLFLILKISDNVLVEMADEFASSHSTANSESIRRYIAYRFLTEEEKQQLHEGLGGQQLENDIKSIFDTRLRVADLRKYTTLETKEKARVWKMATRLETELHISPVALSRAKDIIGFPLGFLCELALDDSLYLTFSNFISHVVNDQLDNINHNARIHCFRVCATLFVNHQKDSTFVFSEYITPQGVPTSKLLLELAHSDLRNFYTMRMFITNQSLQEMNEDDREFWEFFVDNYHDVSFQRYLIENKSRFSEWVQSGIATHTFMMELAKKNLTGIATIQKLVTESALAEMSEDQVAFWAFWKKSSDLEKKVISSNNEKFSQLVVDGVPTNEFYGLVAQEDPKYFVENYNIDKLSSDLDQRTLFRKIIIQTLIEKQTQTPHFQIVYRLLRGEIADRGVISESIKELLNQGYGFEISEEFVKTLDQLIEQSQDEKYSPIIPDKEAFWNDNMRIYLSLKKLKWKVDGFERFRSLVQNSGVNQILSEERLVLCLQQVGQKIGLNAQNIFYVNSSSLLWLYDNRSDENCIVFFKKILNEKPTSFNSCVSTFEQISPSQRGMLFSSPLHQERLIQAMAEFKNVTPSLIEGYVLEENAEKRSDFKEKINEFRRRVHRNLPILVLAQNYDSRRLIADMTALTYPGTNSGQILSQLETAGDRCDDLEGLVIRDGGYLGQIHSKEKVVVLKKEDEPIDEGVINLLRSIFSLSQEASHSQESEVQLASKGWSKLIKEAGSTKSETFFSSVMSEAIACVRVAMGDKAEQFYEMISRDLSQVQTKAELLTKARELFGIYYKDNAAEAIDHFLLVNPDVSERLLSQLSAKRIQALKKNISSSKTISEAKRQEFEQIITNLEKPQNPEEKRKALAGLLAFLSERGLFAGSQGLRKKVENELDKLLLVDKEDGEVVDESLILRGFITKNAASFFAKTTAGVCTAQDFELYHRSDHFHINLVNQEDIVVGNIQGYITEFAGEKALIFRGFNPSSSIVSSTNAAVICDQMVDMVRQIATDNNIKHVLIPQQDNWHPLTNRVGEGVAEYFISRFYKEENKVDFSFEIRSENIITTFYKI